MLVPRQWYPNLWEHLLRSCDRCLDLSDLRHHLADFYSPIGRPSIDPERALAETRVVGDFVFKAQPAEPAIRQVQMGLFTQPPFGADAVAIAHDQHAEFATDRFRARALILGQPF